MRCEMRKVATACSCLELTYSVEMKSVTVQFSDDRHEHEIAQHMYRCPTGSNHHARLDYSKKFLSVRRCASASSVVTAMAPSLCPSVTRRYCIETAEQIELVNLQ